MLKIFLVFQRLYVFCSDLIFDFWCKCFNWLYVYTGACRCGPLHFFYFYIHVYIYRLLWLWNYHNWCHRHAHRRCRAGALHVFRWGAGGHSSTAHLHGCWGKLCLETHKVTGIDVWTGNILQCKYLQCLRLIHLHQSRHFTPQRKLKVSPGTAISCVYAYPSGRLMLEVKLCSSSTICTLVSTRPLRRQSTSVASYCHSVYRDMSLR